MNRKNYQEDKNMEETLTRIAGALENQNAILQNIATKLTDLDDDIGDSEDYLMNMEKDLSQVAHNTAFIADNI